MILHTTGYSGNKGVEGNKLDAFRAFANELDICVIDIRYVPRSMHRMWDQGTLRKTFGFRYFHVPELGNVNYKSVNPSIMIVNMASGIRKVILHTVQAPSGYPTTPLLLCGCEHYAECHRAEVAEALMRTGHFERIVEHRMWALEAIRTPNLILDL